MVIMGVLITLVLWSLWSIWRGGLILFDEKPFRHSGYLYGPKHCTWMYLGENRKTGEVGVFYGESVTFLREYLLKPIDRKIWYQHHGIVVTPSVGIVSSCLICFYFLQPLFWVEWLIGQAEVKLRSRIARLKES